MKRRPPSAIARWERSRAASIARAPGCRIFFPSMAPTTSARIIRRAQFCRRAGAADPPRARSDPASNHHQGEALARPKTGPEDARALKPVSHWFQEPAAKEGDDG